jgi:hypothetical protein
VLSARRLGSISAGVTQESRVPQLVPPAALAGGAQASKLARDRLEAGWKPVLLLRQHLVQLLQLGPHVRGIAGARVQSQIVA